MNIPATELKKSLRPLSPVRTESYQVGEHGLFAGDTDTWVYVESPLSGLGGCFSINGKKLSQVVSRMSGQIGIEKEDKKLVLKSAKARIDLEVQNIKSLKIPDTVNMVTATSLPDFKKALSLAAGSASPNKSAAYGGVVQVQSLALGIEDTHPQGYRIVGTDGAVLTVVTVNHMAGFEFKFLLNLAGASIVQIMDGEVVSIGESDKHVWFKSGAVTLFASKPVQIYPNFDKILVVEPKLRFSFKTEEWLSALRTVEPLIDDVDQGGVGVQISDGVVQFKNTGVGSSGQDEAPYEQVLPDPLFESPVKVSGLRVNAKHLAQFLSRSSGEAILNMTEKNNPIKLESGNVMTLVMPMLGKKETK